MIETDPERPSTAVARDERISRPDGTTEVVSAASVGDARDTNPERLRRLLRGDLDAIVLKALRKEPQRRYPSAEALAQDIERYEEGQPVLAHRGSRTYRFGKLVRRHRAETALVAFVVAAVVGFALFSSAQARRLERERDRAQTEATKAEEVSAFLVSVFEQADPTATRGDTLTAREMLASGAARAETDLAGQPEVQATVLRVIAQAYRGLGREDRARPLFAAVALRREALGDDAPETLAALFDLGTVYEGGGEVELASSAFEEVLLGRRARLGDTHPELLLPLYHLGLIRHMSGRTEEALRLFEEWEALLDRLPEEDSPILSEGLSNYADLMFTQRRYDEAEPHVRRVLAMDRRMHGNESPEVGYALNRLAELMNETGRPEDAEAAAREALAIHRRLYPDGHHELAASLQILGESARRQRRFASADTLLHQDLELRQRLYGADHFSTSRSLMLLGRLNHDREDYREAERYFRAAVDVLTKQFGPAFLTTIQHRLDLTDVLLDQKKYAEAERMLATDNRQVEDRGSEDRTVQLMLQRLVRLYEETGRDREAARFRALLENAPAA